MLSRRMQHGLTGLVVMLTAVAPVALLAQPASAFPKGDPVYKFNYKVIATTHIKKSNQTITPPPGVFRGGIDLSSGKLNGSINLPKSSFTQSEAGVGVVTVTAAIVQDKPVSGHVNLSTLKVTSTSVFDIRITSMYAAVTVPGAPRVNLVGDYCTTASPVSVTMSGIADLGSASKFSGTFTIPNFKSCGTMTSVLNQEIPGPGNTFSAVASPK